MCLVIRFVRSDMTTCSIFLKKFPSNNDIIWSVGEEEEGFLQAQVAQIVLSLKYENSYLY